MLIDQVDILGIVVALSILSIVFENPEEFAMGYVGFGQGRWMSVVVGDGLVGLKSYGLLLEVCDHDLERNTSFGVLDTGFYEAFVSLIKLLERFNRY